MSRSGIAATECPFFEHRTCSVMSDTLNISLRSRFRNRSCVGAPGRSTLPREVAIPCASDAEVAISGQNPPKNRTPLPPRHRNRTPLPPRAPEQHKITAWSARPAQNRHLDPRNHRRTRRGGNPVRPRRRGGNFGTKSAQKPHAAATSPPKPHTTATSSARATQNHRLDRPSNTKLPPRAGTS